MFLSRADLMTTIKEFPDVARAVRAERLRLVMIRSVVHAAKLKQTGAWRTGRVQPATVTHSYLGTHL